MNKLLAIADDFSGAYDIAMQLEKYGITTLLSKETSNNLKDEKAYIFNSNTRNSTPDITYSKIKEFLISRDNSRYDIYYYKIDSMLRGNFCFGIKAIEESIHFDLIAINPSYPELNRTIQNGVVLYQNKPINTTDVLFDPGSPVIESSIENMLKRFFPNNSQHIYLDELRDPDTKIGNSNKIISCDSVTDDDLDIMLHKCMKNKIRILWVGSIGLIQALLRKKIKQKPTLTIMGSVCEMTRTQTHYALEHNIKVIFIDISLFMQEKNDEIYVQKALNYIQQEKDVLICTAIKEDHIMAITDKINKSNVLNRINQILIQTSIKIIDRGNVDRIFITGGDTASCFFEMKFGQYPHFIKEIAPSIPLTKIKNQEGKIYKIAFKSGHVGDERTILHCIKKLKEEL